MLKNLDRYRLIPFVQYSVLWIVVSAVVILIGAGAMVYNKRTIGSYLYMGIDFTGGSLVELRLEQPVTAQDLAAIVAPFSEGEPLVQPRKTDPREVEIRMRIKTEGAETEAQQGSLRVEKLSEMIKAVEAKYGGPGTAVVLQEAYVGPVVGKELIMNAILALILGSIAIMIYIFVRFNSFVYSIAGIVSLLHDVLIAIGGAALLRLEINSFFIAVILTIIGYSINDTIIVYDRIRENNRNLPQLNFPTIINLSITQTLTRSIATVSTVLFMLLALLLFGGPPLYSFSMALLIGVFSGMYSSIFIAAPIVLYFTPGTERQRIPKYVDLFAAYEQVASGEYDEEEAAIYEEEEKETVLALKAERKPEAARAARELVGKADDEVSSREAADKAKKKKKKLRRR